MIGANRPGTVTNPSSAAILGFCVSCEARRPDRWSLGLTSPCGRAWDRRKAQASFVLADSVTEGQSQHRQVGMGHIGATRLRSAPDNHGQRRSAIGPAQASSSARPAGRAIGRLSLTRKMSYELPCQQRRRGRDGRYRRRPGGARGRAAQAPLSSVRAGSVPQRSTRGTGGHQRSLTV
jgi:hypothetical protein